MRHVELSDSSKSVRFECLGGPFYTVRTSLSSGQVIVRVHLIEGFIDPDLMDVISFQRQDLT